MTDGDALYRAILEQPDDDAPRLVWADWLEEHGGPDRAAFVRLQCEWVATDPGDPRRDELWQRWLTLLEARGSGWRDELEPDARPAGYWRALPDWFVLTTDEVVEQLTRLRERVPAQCVVIELAGFREQLRQWPGLSDFRCLTVAEPQPDPYYQHASPRGWVWLIQSPRLAGLRRFAAAFDLSSSGILAALAGTDWPDLRELDLRVSRADPGRPHRAWNELPDAPWFPQLKSLNLTGAWLGDRGVLRLVARGRPLALTELVVSGNNLTPAGIRRLIARAELRQLRAVVAGSRARPPRYVDGVAVYE
jgi:uncharacterized protein (TIGR02996 family)